MLKTVEDLRAAVGRQRSAIDEARERLLKQETRKGSGKRTRWRVVGLKGNKPVVAKVEPAPPPPPPAPVPTAGLVRLKRPCLTQTFKTYLRVGSQGRIVGRLNGRLMILFPGAFVVIPAESPLIEVLE